jgi:negative regulator of replication initiation
LRALLFLEPSATFGDCLRELERLLPDQMGASKGSYNGTTREMKESPSSSSYQRLVREVKAALGVSDATAIIPLINQLVRRVRLYDETFPSIDKLVNTLFGILKVFFRLQAPRFVSFHLIQCT